MSTSPDFGFHDFQKGAFDRQVAGIAGFILDAAAGGSALIGGKDARTQVDDRAAGHVGGHMGADHTAVFLADHLQARSVQAFDTHHVCNEGRIQLDRQAGAQVHAEGVIGNQDDGVGGQHVDQQFPDDFSIGVGQRVIVELEDLGIGGGHGIGHGVKAGTRTGHDGGNGCTGVDLLGRGNQFQGRIIGHAVFMSDVCIDIGHYFNPPLAFKSSISLATISSVLPSSMSAPSPISGTK